MAKRAVFKNGDEFRAFVLGLFRLNGISLNGDGFSFEPCQTNNLGIGEYYLVDNSHEGVEVRLFYMSSKGPRFMMDMICNNCGYEEVVFNNNLDCDFMDKCMESIENAKRIFNSGRFTVCSDNQKFREVWDGRSKLDLEELSE